jgi:hypothetical protein
MYVIKTNKGYYTGLTSIVHTSISKRDAIQFKWRDQAVRTAKLVGGKVERV